MSDIESIDTITCVKLAGCARCGGTHEHVTFRPMAKPFAPPEANGMAWTHWAPCPTNGDPILLSMAVRVAELTVAAPDAS